MVSKVKATLAALAALALAGTALALPPYTPAGFPLGAMPGPSSNPCNNGGPTAPQELGYGIGNSLGSGNTDYHRYTNGSVIRGLDSCDSFSGVPAFATCALATETAAVNDGAATALAGPLPGSVSAGAGIIVTQTGNVITGAACGGIGGTGTDGEFEYGSASAFLNVRTTAGPNGGDGLQGCYNLDVTPNPADDCGNNAAEGCLADAFVLGSDHHAIDTNIVVMDVALGGSVAFTVVSDWARPASTSNSGADLNKISGQKHCGDGVIEPCIAGLHAGLANDISRGDLTSGSNGNPGNLFSDTVWLVNNPPSTEPQLDQWNQVRLGCNPLDYFQFKPAVDPLTLPASNDFNPPGATLADFGNVGYTGGAAGYLIVLVAYDNPGGVLHAHATTGVATAGWVWTY